MNDSMRELIRAWDGLAVVVRHDEPSGAWFFVALHDATLGPPTGGCRMQVYGRPEDGLLDAMRLARGMTHKWAGIGLEVGGGKSVIALSRPLEGDERAGILRRFARLVNALRGAYWGGEDLGTTPADMAAMARETPYIHGIRPRPPPPGARPPANLRDRSIEPGSRPGSVVPELGEVRKEGQLDRVGRTVAMLGHDEVGRPLPRQVLRRVVPMDEHDHV
jgi:leucine dehydrogenase